MSMADVAENAVMALIFNASAWANVAINATSSPITALATSLHTADPTDSGNMSSSEAGYTSYARQNVTRDSSGWTITANSVSPTSIIAFPACTGSTSTVTHMGVGKTGGGSADLYFSGAVSPNLSVSTGVTPRLNTSTTITLD